MEHSLVKRYNQTVDPEDCCYFLGDLGRDIKKVLPKLNGTKIFIPGNHDHIGVYAALEIGFAAVIHNGAIKVGSKIITMSHCPLRGVFREDVTGMKGSVEGDNWHGESRHQMFSIEDHGGLHIHGHNHSTKKQSKLGRQWDIGVKGNNWAPVSISSIESWATKALKNG